jgi:hypothetical protein
MATISSNSRHQTCRSRPHSSFAATGQENLRVVLAGCHGGSINQLKMLLMYEQVHEASLQALLHQEQGQELRHFAVAASDPAWSEALTPRYARRVQQRLFRLGGCLHKPERRQMERS